MESGSKIRLGPARDAAGPNQLLSLSQLLTVVLTIVVVMAVFPIVPPVFAADIMTVDPVVMVLGPMAGHPDHFIFPLPIAGTMVIIGPISNFDPEFLCRKSGWENDARSHCRDE